MRVKVRRIGNREEEQVIIECVEITPEIEELHSYILTKGKELSGVAEGKTYRFRLEDVLYFEALDEKVFAYTAQNVYECRMKLYEAEQAYRKYYFARCAKSLVINLMQLQSISPALNGRFYAHMKNGETLVVSRQYVPILKQKIMGESIYEK